MKLALDWRAYDSYGQGDAYADIPARGEGFGKAAAVCIGSRQCQKARGEAGDKGVMCPSFRITQDDLHSTRGRAAALRAALDGEAGTLAGPELDRAMELCVACKGCKRECPNGVDMAALRAETLAQRWQTATPPWRTRFFAGLGDWLPTLAKWRTVAGAALWLRRRVPGAARLMERLTGISARRSLPLPAATGFMQAPPAATVAAPRREVVLLVDCFSNHLEPEIAHAAFAVLQALGCRVHPVGATAGQPLCCGRPAWSAGLIDAARAHAQALLAALSPHVAAGRVVIGLEPSCLTMLRDEYLMLGLDEASVQALAKATLTLEEFLAREVDPKQVPWQPLAAEVHVHGHCHQKAFGTLKALRKLLGTVPGLQVNWIESSCCGMAGSFGYEAEHHAASMAMAELSLLPAVRAAASGATIVASGTSCRQQIRDGTGRAPVHLAQLLQAALKPDALGPGALGPVAPRPATVSGP